LSHTIVVGGGVIGCGIALRLAQAGMQVTLVERASAGAEASRAAAGVLGAQLGAERPGPFLDLCLRSRGMYPAFVDELQKLSGINVRYLSCGALVVAITDAEAQAMEATVAWHRAVGLRAELLSQAEISRIEPRLSSQIVLAIHFPDDHQVDNRLLVRAVSLAAARAGAQLRTAEVRGVVADHGRAVGVDLDGEVLRSDAVVVAAGSWSSLLAGLNLDVRVVRPVRGQMVRLQSQLSLLQRIVIGPNAVLVPRIDGQVIAGTTLEFAGFEKQVTASAISNILRGAIELCPALADAPIQELWSGLRPHTDDGLPIIGPGPMAGLFLATGHYRDGILLAPITAKLITELILGGKPSVDLRPFRFERLAAGSPVA